MSDKSDEKLLSDREMKCHFCGEKMKDISKAQLNVDKTWIRCDACRVWQRLIDFRRAGFNV